MKWDAHLNASVKEQVKLQVVATGTFEGSIFARMEQRVAQTPLERFQKNRDELMKAQAVHLEVTQSCCEQEATFAA